MIVVLQGLHKCPCWPNKACVFELYTFFRFSKQKFIFFLIFKMVLTKHGMKKKITLKHYIKYGMPSFKYQSKSYKHTYAI